MRLITRHSDKLLVVFIAFSAFSNSCNTKTKKPVNPVIEETKPVPPDTIIRGNISYLSSDSLQNYITSAPTFTILNKLKAPFNKLVFNKIIAYDYDGSEEPYPSVFGTDKKFIPIIEKQKALNILQAKEIIDLLTSTSTYGDVTAACFNPHLSFVFYDSIKPVFNVDICLGCNYLIATEEIPAMDFKKINKGTEDEYSAIGFSDKGRLRIKQLGKQLKFYYGIVE